MIRLLTEQQQLGRHNPAAAGAPSIPTSSGQYQLAPTPSAVFQMRVSS